MGSTISATASELRGIALDSTDARGYFAAMYARVTARIAAAIDSDRFTDGPRMDEFATAFANYYVHALRGTVPAPRCWQASWDVAGDHKLLIVQHLLLGINAHVNHDLALTVVEVAGIRGEIGSIRPDFNAVNDVLAETYDDLLSDLGRVSRWATAASSKGGADAFNFSLRHAREQAWRAAVAMHTLNDAELRAYQTELDRCVSALAYIVTRPPRLARPLVWLARRFESNDARKVTRRLLGNEDLTPSVPTDDD
jgi:hypothetical protein